MPRLNVMDCGARGDGVTDDTPAFRAALSKSMCLYVPAGTYRIDGLLVHDPGVTIRGDGPGQTVLLDSGGPTLQFDGSRCFVAYTTECAGSADCCLQDLTLRGRGVMPAGVDRDEIGLLVHGAPRQTLRNVTVERFAGRGLMLHHRLTTGGLFDGVTVCDVCAARIGNASRHGWGVTVYGGGNWGAPSDCVFRNLRVERTTQAGLAFDAGTSNTIGFQPTAIRVDGLTLVDCATSYLGDAAALTFSGSLACRVDWLTVRYLSRPPGKTIAFSVDNDSQKHIASWNTVSGGVILGCGPDPIAKNGTDGTNVVRDIVLQGWLGGTQRIERTTY